MRRQPDIFWNLWGGWRKREGTMCIIVIGEAMIPDLNRTVVAGGTSVVSLWRAKSKPIQTVCRISPINIIRTWLLHRYQFLNHQCVEMRIWCEKKQTGQGEWDIEFSKAFFHSFIDCREGHFINFVALCWLHWHQGGHLVEGMKTAFWTLHIQ